MFLSHLHLKSYFITEFHLKTEDKYEPQKERKYEIKKLRADVQHLINAKDPNLWQVRLSLSYKPVAEENAPYGFSLSVVGVFEVDKNCPHAQVRPLMAFNAPAMLYSAMREFMAIVSGRGPWGPILLPTVSFLPTRSSSPDKGTVEEPATHSVRNH